MSIELFAIATKNKYRFKTAAGLISVEDLWDLPLSSTNPRATSLDVVARIIHKELNETETSFVGESTASNTELQNKFNIVKFIIDKKKADKEAAAKRRETIEKNQRIAELIARKQDQQLENLSIEELEKLLEQ